MLCLDAPKGEYPCMGYVIYESDCIPKSWCSDGVYWLSGDDDDKVCDIVSEWKEPEVHEFWKGMFSNGGSDAFRYISAQDVFEDGFNFAVKFRLTVQPDGKQHLEILEQINREDV